MNMKTEVSDSVCPLCGNNNACMNVFDPSNSVNCWCMANTIQFPEALLNQVPAEKRGLACICQACAMKYQKSQGVKIYKP